MAESPRPIHRIGDLTLEIVEGDIAAQRTDAIVNAANDALWMGAGVAGAIKARGGPSIECEAMGFAPVPLGEAVVTSAGRLAAKFVIHAVVMGQDLRTDGGVVARAAASALAVANARGLASVALPALGTGVGAFPLARCAELMTAAVKAHAAVGTTLRRVVFVLWGAAAFDVFARTVRGVLGEEPR